MAADAAEGWQRLANLLAARRIAPSLVPEPCPDASAVRRPCGSEEKETLSASLRIAGAVMEDRLADALAEPVMDREARLWRTIALRRAGRFPEARRAFRELGARPEDAQLYERALAVLRTGGGGFRWAAESAAHLAARGSWDPVWFVDACAAAHAGLLSRESAALLTEIQRAELQLLLDARAAG